MFLKVILTLVAILGIRTVHFTYRDPTTKSNPCKPTDDDYIPLTKERLGHFQRALQFQTVSESPGVYNREELYGLGEYLIASFPNVHSMTEWERVNNYSLLYHIKGSDPSLKPYLLMAHLDVASADNLDKWEAPPFSGDVVGGFIYGRGAMDMKHCVMGILEATEYMLSKGIKPKRSFFIAFGHDEEVMGFDGAKSLAQRLRDKGVKELEFISDEGHVVHQNIIAGVQGPVGTVGVVEKGRVAIKLSVDAPNGHGSMPTGHSSINILAAALTRLENNPHPSQLGSGVETAVLEALAPQMSIAHRVVIANIWFFRPILSWVLAKSPTTNALIRTVRSVTMFNSGGVKTNVLPPYAEATLSYRVHPSQTIEEVLAYDSSVIADERVDMEVLSSMEATPTAGFGEDNFGYQVMKTSIGQIWPEALVTPGIMFGGTDSVHYLDFTHNVYRFSPLHLFPGDPDRIHGINERISEVNFGQVINFFYHLIKNCDKVEVSPNHNHEDP